MPFLRALIQAGQACAAPAPAPAATPEYLSGALRGFEGAGAAAPEAPSLLPTLFNLGFSLALVVALIYAVYFVLRRWRQGQGISSPGAEGAIKVLEKTWLDNRHALALVEVGEKVYFLGLGEDVTELGKIDDPELIEKIREKAPAPGKLLSFGQELEKIGMQLRRDQWKRSRQDLKAEAGKLDDEISKLRGPRKGGS